MSEDAIAYGEQTPLYWIIAPTANGGRVYMTHVFPGQRNEDDVQDCIIAATNMRSDAATWTKAGADELVGFVRRHWIMATVRRAT